MRKLPTPHTDTIDKWDTFTDKQKELKIYKDLVHQYIDLIWGVRGYCKRGELYQHIANNFGWNIPLDIRDTGVRSVQSITFESANGGIFALVLCKDLGAVTIREANVPAEKDFLLETGYNMPRIYDGAFLSFLLCPNASIAAVPIIGSIQTVWG